MGFDWTPISIGTRSDAAHQNEVKTNVDVVYSDLELSPYNWIYLPVSSGDELDDADYQELRTAIDYADNQNYCRSYDAAYNGADNAIAKTGVDTTAYSLADSPHYATVYSTQDSGYDSTYDAGVDGAYDSTVQASYNYGVDTGYDSTVQASYNYGVDSGFDSTVYSWNEAAVAANYKLAYYIAQNVTYNSGYG